MLGCTKSCGFTFLQLQELEHQALIYKYLEAGLPVPYHLVYPIWKSVACSLEGVTAAAAAAAAYQHHHHPGCKWPDSGIGKKHLSLLVVLIWGFVLNLKMGLFGFSDFSYGSESVIFGH